MFNCILISLYIIYINLYKYTSLFIVLFITVLEILSVFHIISHFLGHSKFPHFHIFYFFVNTVKVGFKFWNFH